MLRSISDTWLARSKQLREFVRAGSASIVIQVLNRLVMLALGVMLARQLGPTEYGFYAYAFAWLSTLVVFADLGISQYTLRETAGLRETADREALRGAIWDGAWAVLSLSVVVAALGLSALTWFEPSAQVQVTSMVMWLLPAAVLVRFWSHTLRGLGSITLGQLLDQILLPVLVLGGIVLVFLFGMRLDAMTAMFIQIAVAVVVGIGGLVLIVRRLPPIAVRVKHVLALLPLALPFGLLAGINVLNGQVDILMLGYFAPAEQVGIYRIAVLGAALVAFGLQAANVVLPTLFARLQAQNNQQELQALVTLSARLILATALPVALLFWMWGDHIVSWVFGEAYVAAYWPLAVLAMGELVGASMGSLGFLLYMSGEERRALQVLGGTALLNVLLNLILIPQFGMTGAAIATAVGQGVRLVLLYWLVVRHLNLSPVPFRLKRTHS